MPRSCLFHGRENWISIIQSTRNYRANVLSYLIAKGRDTEYGRAHTFENINSYDDFAKKVPVNTYEELKGDIDRMRHGETNVLWPDW